MDATGIERTLKTCEDALAQGGTVDLVRLGFWRAVTLVKRTPGAPQRYGERVAAIDREAFVRGARPLVFPAALGVVLEGAGTLVGLALVTIAPSLPRQDLAPGFDLTGIAYLAGAGVLIGATHGLAHWAVGSAMGIRFTHWYSRPPKSPQPGFKTDYATYLRAPARSRAWMHASGAIVSKIIPFAVAALAAGGGAQPWTVWALLALGVFQLVTDLTLSTRASDWKKFRREMRFAP